MSRRNVDRACCVFVLVAGALSASCGGARVVQGEPPPLVFDRLPPAPPMATATAEVSLLSLVRQRATCLRTLDGGGPWCGGPDAGALLSKSEAAGEREALETFIAALTDPDPYVAWVATIEVLTPYPSLHHDDRYSPGPTDQTGARAPSLVCTDGALGDRLLDAVERFADRPARTPSPALHIGDRVACIDIRAERRWARLEAIVRTHGSPLLRQSAVLGLRTHHADAPRVAALLRELLEIRTRTSPTPR